MGRSCEVRVRAIDASAARRVPTSAVTRLLDEPHRFGFFQAVRLLSRWIDGADGARRGAAGGVAAPIRFRNNLSLAFPASEISVFDVVPAQADLLPAAESGDPAPDPASVARIELTPAFMGLLGTGGALPTFYTELLAERETYHRDAAARAFLDIFQHRAVSLFYAAWRKSRLAAQFEDDARNRFLPLVLAVAGVGQAPLRDRLHGESGGVADDTLAYYSGHLHRRPVSAAALRQVLADYFAVPVEVEQFVGRWFPLPADCTSLLGLGNAVLGRSAVLGERVWQRDLRLRLVVGPMGRAKLRRFLPGGPAALALRELLTLLTGVTLEYEVRLKLAAAEVRGSTLGDGEDGAEGAALGWDSFLVTEPSTEDRSDAGYDLLALH